MLAYQKGGVTKHDGVKKRAVLVSVLKGCEIVAAALGRGL